MIEGRHPALDDLAISMKGCGFYDRNCTIQETVAGRVESVLARVVGELELSHFPRPFTIVDYGCAEGRNSLRLSNFIIERLKQRGFSDEIHVIHNDLGDNDFANLIDVVVDEHRGHDDAVPLSDNVVRTLAPGSFYNQLIDDGVVGLAMSTTSVHWLASTSGLRIAEHVSAEGAPTDVQMEMASVARRDWVQFLRCRAAELADGGRLIVSMVGRFANDSTVHGPFRLLDDIARRWLRAGKLSQEQYERFVLPVYRRTQAEAISPIATGGELCSELALDHCEQFQVACPFYAQYECDGDRLGYAQHYAGFVRAIGETVVAQLLGAGNPLSMDQTRVDAFFADLEARAAESPGEFVPTNVHVLVVATKQPTE